MTALSNLKGAPAAMDTHSRHLYEFGPFTVDPVERLLLREGQPIPLKAKVFDVLLVLITKSGHLVEKSELMSALWPDTFVEESNLTVSVSLLRKALGDDGVEHKYIQTVSGRGYRFLGEVRKLGEPKDELSAPPRHRGPLSSALYAICLILIALMIAVVIMARSRKPSGVQTEIHSLAVLPFQFLGSDNAQGYLSLGIADAIITRLGSTGQIPVRPTSAVGQYVNSPADPVAIGRQQKVDAILTGHLKALSDRTRVTVQLVRVADGVLLWAGTFEESPDQMFALEDDVAERIVQLMPLRLSSEERVRLARPSTENSKAYQLYLEGRYFRNKRTTEGLQRSIEDFHQATTQDGQFALAYAGLADSYILLGARGLEPSRRAFEDARTAVLRSLQLDNSLAEAHASLGMIYFYYEWNWSEAEQEFRTAIDLNPNYAVAYDRHALFLAAMARPEESFVEVRHAHELDPLSLDINTVVGRIFYLSRRYDQSIDAYRKVIDLDPYYARAYTRLGMTYAVKGAFTDAIREFGESERLAGADPYLDGLLGYARARSGNTVKAREVLEQLIRRSRRENVPAYSMALVYIGLGERDKALEWLDKAFQDRSTYLVYAKIDPLLDPVRSDPRFAALLHRMGLS
jgi:DNA-binding winged helix-turn-helix (wHTH) protein/TolB-like protein/Tfp pilus assembly protein PilF